MPKTDVTMLFAVHMVRNFICSAPGTTTRRYMPDGECLSCDWGYVLDGLDEIERYLTGKPKEWREICQRLT